MEAELTKQIVQHTLQRLIDSGAEVSAIYDAIGRCNDNEGRRIGATREEIESARQHYHTHDVEIDDDAWSSPCDDGSVWVHAWVLLENE